MTSPIRQTGLNSLKTVIKQEQNIRIIEKSIHKSSQHNPQDYEKKYKRILYQTIQDITTKNNLKNILNNINNNKTEWNHPAFTNVRNRIEEHDDFIINPFEVVEGVTTCKCGSNRVFTYQKQTRSADEPMTTFAKCVSCKKTWSYSG